MRVTTTFGSLILGAGLCAARACVPHPRPTTTSSFSSEIGTTTAGGSATTVTSQETISFTESESSIEASATKELETTTSGLTSQETLSVTATIVESSATTELETTTSGLTSQEISSATESQTSGESSATTTTTDDISSFTTILTTTTAVTSQETETSTAADDATSTTIEATTTTAGPPVVTNLVQNGGFEDGTVDPWTVEGASPAVFSSFFCTEGKKCMQLPGNLDDSAKVCQRVAVEAGFEYTFKALVLQNCIKSYGSNIEVCEDNVNTADLSIDGVFDSGEAGIVGYNTYTDFTYTFSYTGPSIDSTDICITITQNQGISPNFYLDGVSLTQGKAVPIPDPTE
ncbi:hypothetical protein FSPOR_11504 [Fusarium sporotrichioides]|uniref:CBM-cenC domain-containing protein n=1 Tax=Fusarium sporotrichioides TaxID=5514 RepID=A0A395RGI7_FUSSP|nr:hypothetical protein FSPOR_11504 [Fusarium sporotrichioides]